MEKITKKQYFAFLKQKTAKYGNLKTTTKRGIFHSILEADYEEELFQRSRAKDIKDYACQVSLPLVVNGQHIAKYIADFIIRHNDDSLEIIETKGYLTSTASLKMKLVKALYGDKYKITIVKKK